MAKRRELVQLADTFDPKKHKIGGWFLSEKLDGTRCFWDGGLTRGMRTEDVPWAGVLNPKTGEKKDKVKPISTGLWSRYGNPIIAPDWWLDTLPACPLDGELFAGRGKFQLTRSIVGCDVADDRWKDIDYMVYGSPPMAIFTRPGLIKSAQMLCEIPEDTLQFVMERMGNIGPYQFLQDDMIFADEYLALHDPLGNPGRACLHLQIKLPEDHAEALTVAQERIAEWVAGGAEGGIVRNPNTVYDVKRSKNLLKIKPSSDTEGTLVGFTAGRGKYEGAIGALILDYKGQRLELSGLTDEERTLYVHPETSVPGKDLDKTARATYFTIGQQITFTYRELSDDGIPKEARYLRVRTPE